MVIWLIVRNRMIFVGGLNCLYFVKRESESCHIPLYAMGNIVLFDILLSILKLVQWISGFYLSCYVFLFINYLNALD